jgi:hypothetical protein
MTKQGWTRSHCCCLTTLLWVVVKCVETDLNLNVAAHQLITTAIHLFWGSLLSPTLLRFSPLYLERGLFWIDIVIVLWSPQKMGPLLACDLLYSFGPIETRLRVGRPGFSFPAKEMVGLYSSSPLCPDQLCSPPSLHFNGYRGYSAQDVKLTTYLNLVPRLGIRPRGVVRS